MNDAIIWEPIPQILEMVSYDMPESVEATAQRLVKDYEIDFFLKGNGSIYLNGVLYSITPGTVMFRRPGQYCHSIAPYSCYALTLNFSEDWMLSQPYNRKRPGLPQPPIHHPCFDRMPAFFNVQTPLVYRHIFSKLHTACRMPSANELPIKMLLTELFLNLLTDSVKTLNSRLQPKNRVDPVLTKACAYIQENLQQKITLFDIAGVVHLSPNYLHRIFVKKMQTTPGQYLQSVRFEKACLLLLDSNNSVEWISEQCGFNSVSYFIKQFREKYGVTPSAYRKTYRNI